MSLGAMAEVVRAAMKPYGYDVRILSFESPKDKEMAQAYDRGRMCVLSQLDACIAEYRLGLLSG